MTPNEFNKKISTLIMALCVQEGPEAWDKARSRIVEVKMPDKLVANLKAIYERMPLTEETNLAEFESAVIDTLVMEGLKSKATGALLDRLEPILKGILEEEE